MGKRNRFMHLWKLHSIGNKYSKSYIVCLKMKTTTAKKKKKKEQGGDSLKCMDS